LCCTVSLRAPSDTLSLHDALPIFVSLEVSPYLAMDTKATIAEAERLWKDVKRKNLMVKVPATPEGLPAIEHLIGEGISINITLRSEEHTSELQSRVDLVCRLLLEK